MGSCEYLLMEIFEKAPFVLPCSPSRSSAEAAVEIKPSLSPIEALYKSLSGVLLHFQTNFVSSSGSGETVALMDKSARCIIVDRPTLFMSICS